MFNRIASEKIYCGLDLGSQKIKIGVYSVKNGAELKLLGAYEHPTQGFIDGSVSNLSELSECIHQAINYVEKKANVRVKEVQLGLGGELIDVRETSTVIPLTDRGTKVIVNRDIKKVNDQARLLGMRMDEEVLHDIPQHYQVDEINMALNPLGLLGRKLGVHALMMLTHVSRLRNITKAVHEAGYDIGSIFFSSYAASVAALTDEDKAKGCVLVDIGSKITSVLVFKDNTLKYFDKIKIGGDHFTRNIAANLNLTHDLAEEIKKSYAVALDADQQNEEEILVKREDMYIPIKRESIYQAIKPDIETLVTNIKAAIRASGLFEQINAGISMVGGGALLPGLMERIEQDVNFPVRLSKIVIPSQKSFTTNAPVFASVIGLVQSAYFKNIPARESSNGENNWAKSVVNKMMELYQEYF